MQNKSLELLHLPGDSENDGSVRVNGYCVRNLWGEMEGHKELREQYFLDRRKLFAHTSTFQLFQNFWRRRDGNCRGEYFFYSNSLETYLYIQEFTVISEMMFLLLRIL